MITVQQELDNRKNDNSLPRTERSDAAIRKWAERAVSDGGAAFWENPRTTKVCPSINHAQCFLLLVPFKYPPPLPFFVDTRKRHAAVSLCSANVRLPSAGHTRLSYARSWIPSRRLGHVLCCGKRLIMLRFPVIPLTRIPSDTTCFHLSFRTSTPWLTS